MDKATKRLNERMAAVEKIRAEIERVSNEKRVHKERHQMLTDKKHFIGDQLHNIGRMREPKVGKLVQIDLSFRMPKY